MRRGRLVPDAKPSHYHGLPIYRNCYRSYNCADACTEIIGSDRECISLLVPLFSRLSAMSTSHSLQLFRRNTLLLVCNRVWVFLGLVSRVY